MTAAQFELIDETEAEAILRWRFEELVRSGYDIGSALVLASHVEIDLHDASALTRRGCPRRDGSADSPLASGGTKGRSPDAAGVPALFVLCSRSWFQKAPLERTRRSGSSPAGDAVVRRQRSRRALGYPRGAGRGLVLHGLVRETDDEAEWRRVMSFPQFGVNLFVLEPGEPMSVYHGRGGPRGLPRARRTLRAAHRGGGAVIGAVGLRALPRLDRAHDRRRGRRLHASSSPSVRAAVTASASRVDEAAAKRGASAERETSDGSEAYARFQPGRETPYRDGWLSEA